MSSVGAESKQPATLGSEDSVMAVPEASSDPQPVPSDASQPSMTSAPAPKSEQQAKETNGVTRVQQTSAAPEVKTPDGQAFRPTRRVREPIGGGSAQIGALFGGGSDDYNDAVREAEREQAKRRGLAVQDAPPVKQSQMPLSSIENHQEQQSHQKQEQDSDSKPLPTAAVFRPTRRVR
jgi:hypothetical protein